MIFGESLSESFLQDIFSYILVGILIHDPTNSAWIMQHELNMIFQQINVNFSKSTISN